jgi:hypothetical protein
MCEKIIERLPSMTAAERQQLRRNCERASRRSTDRLIVQEAERVVAELDALEFRESRFLDRLPTARKIEYAFRRLPASEGERHLIRILHENAGAPLRRVSAACGDADDLSWVRRLWEMCRDRRHLIGEVVPADDDAQPHTEEPMAAPFIQVDQEGREVRLIPDAVEAFASIGYVERQAA